MLRRMTMILLALATTVLVVRVAGATAWPAERAWSPAEEDAFSTWVAEVGVKPRRSVNHLIRDPRHNRLYDPSDLDLHLLADCADLPVVLRAYYAYKRRLPFVLTRVDGSRYSRDGNRTIGTLDNLSYPGDAAAFLRMVPNVLHTGTFRTVPSAPASLTRHGNGSDR